MSKKIYLVMVLKLLLLGCASLRPTVWDVETLFNNGQDYIDFNDDKGRTVNRINASQIQLYFDTCKNISSVPNVPIKFVIINKYEPNASAYIQDDIGYIAFYFGIIELLGDDVDMTAALCGHEIAHLVHDHQLNRMYTQTGVGVLETIGGNILESYGVIGGSILTQIAASAASASYSRDQEIQADKFGLEYMIKAGYDPDGAIRLYQAFNKISELPSISYFDTHPSNHDRIEYIEQIIREYNNRPNSLLIDN